jgi:hypothetical protein
MSNAKVDCRLPLPDKARPTVNIYYSLKRLKGDSGNFRFAWG